MAPARCSPGYSTETTALNPPRGRWQLTRLASLAWVLQQYEDALPLLAAHVIGDAKMEALDSALERWMPGLTNQPGYAGLRCQIALRWVDGESPREIVEQATWWRDQGLTTLPKTLPPLLLEASQGAAWYRRRLAPTRGCRRYLTRCAPTQRPAHTSIA